jgi:hypothetical protein
MLMRVITFSTLLLAVLSSGSEIVQARSPLSGRPCAPSYHATCYSPAEADAAARAFAPRAASPVAVVVRVTHMKLAQIAIIHEQGKPTSIYYSFGMVIPLDKTIPSNGPNYVAVVEYPGRFLRHLGIKIQTQGKAALVTGSFAHHSLSFSVSGRGVPLQELIRIGRSLVNA